MNNLKLWIASFLIALLLGTLGYSYFSDRIYTAKTEAFISNNVEFEKITIVMSDVQWGDSLKSAIIIDPSSIRSIQNLLKKNILIFPDRPNVQSASINLSFYRKKERAEVDAYKSKYNGWIIRVGVKWYKNDILISALLSYLSNAKMEYAN
jgi:hypothetical protein